MPTVIKEKPKEKPKENNIHASEENKKTKSKKNIIT